MHAKDASNQWNKKFQKNWTWKYIKREQKGIEIRGSWTRYLPDFDKLGAPPPGLPNGKVAHWKSRERKKDSVEIVKRETNRASHMMETVNSAKWKR